MTQNRKRCRSLQTEDEVEFMPLSKRINNLHILEQPTEWGPGPPQHCLPESPAMSEASLDWTTSTQPQYAPDLTENQNPHYFNINKLLFEMYLQRLQRAGCQQIA